MIDCGGTDPNSYHQDPIQLSSDQRLSFIMISADEIEKRLLICGVLAIAVLPRQHIDRHRCSIGGSLSFKFKELLVILVGLNLLRLASSDEQRSASALMLSDVLGVFEVVGLSFLSFLSPYILQTWLQERINIGGRPGANLLFPFYMTIVVSVMGVTLSRTTHPNFWMLKKLANILSTPAVLKTLGLFNTVTTRGGHHDGRGTIMSQTLMVVEYWHFVTQTLCAMGYAFDAHKEQVADYTQWDQCLAAFRSISFVSDWLRVCAHAIFINLLDEMFLSSSPTSDSGGGGTAANNDDAVSEAGPSDEGAGMEVKALMRRTVPTNP